MTTLTIPQLRRQAPGEGPERPPLHNGDHLSRAEFERREDGYLVGAPELIVEVAVTSAAYDLHEKLRVYHRNGVLEYPVLLAHERETRWFHLVEGEYTQFAAGDEGVLQSRAFPGLHFDSALFWKDDLASLLQTFQEGLATPEHEAFIQRLSGAGAE